MTIVLIIFLVLIIYLLSNLFFVINVPLFDEINRLIFYFMKILGMSGDLLSAFKFFFERFFFPLTLCFLFFYFKKRTQVSTILKFLSIPVAIVLGFYLFFFPISLFIFLDSLLSLFLTTLGI